MVSEQLLETDAVSVRRLNGLVRDFVDGKHKRLLVIAAPTVGDAELVRLLHDAAGRIERTLPRAAE